MKWLGFGATNLYHAIKLTGSKLAKKSDNTQLFYIMCYVALFIMGIQMYFINETKKQVVDTKKLYGDFEDKQQLLCYLNICQGDIIRTEFENSRWVEDFNDGKYPDFKQIRLYEFAIYPDDDLYNNADFERLQSIVNAI